MELISYDEPNETSTVKMTDIELVDLHSVLAGILSTIQNQDETILGVSEIRMNEIKENLMTILEKRNGVMKLEANSL